MDAVLDVLLVLSLAGVIAYAFAVYEALKIMTAVLVLCFLAVAL